MKWDCYHRRHISRGFGSLIEILIVAVIILCGAALYMGMMRGSTSASNAINNPETGVGPAAAGGPQSIPARALQKAHSIECENNIRQLRILIETAKNESENGATYPSSLAGIPEAAKISSCPVGHEPYQYDPTTGKVHCVHPGHEGY